MANRKSGVVPMIAYEDGPNAMEWLASAFGFREQARMLGRDGRLAHGEMDTGRGLIMLATPAPDYESLATIANGASGPGSGRGCHG